jgi:hypothetical protein
MGDPMLKDFVLVGGTALSLMIGHRISIDLDFFSVCSFDQDLLASYLENNYDMRIDFLGNDTIKGEISGVKIDFIAHQYPWIGEPSVYEDIRLADIRDIAAMKMNAIAGNGTRIKDFIDIAYLSSSITLTDMLKAYESKYKANVVMPLKGITFFNEINFSEPIRMANNKPFKWEPISKRLIMMQISPDKIFPVIQ